MRDHKLVNLQADSPHIGEMCPVRRKPFEAGDSVVLCQESNTFVSQESVSFLNGYCPICGDYVNLPLASFPETIKMEFNSPVPPEKSRYTTPERRVSAENKIIVFVAILFVGILLGGITIWAMVGRSGPGATPTSIISEVANDDNAKVSEDRPVASPTPRSTSRPDPTARPTATRKPTPTSKPRPANTPSISRTDIEDLLERWDEVHHQADRNWDTSQLNTVLHGEALSEQRTTVNTLKDNNCYWVIQDLVTPRISRYDIVNSDYLIVEVDKSWDMDRYCNGRKNGDDYNEPQKLDHELRWIKLSSISLWRTQNDAKTTTTQ